MKGIRMEIFSYLLILFIINISLSKTSPRKENDDKSSEGDKLIKKILSADRFDELAEKIADKAIWKLNHQNSTATSRFERNKHSDPEFKSTIETTEVKPKKNKHKRHKSAIDVDAVLKNKVIPLVDLSFRYEHFTKGFNTYVSSEGKSLKKTRDSNKDSSNESMDKDIIKQNVSQKTNVQDVGEKQNKILSDEKNNSEETAIINEQIHIETSSNITTKEDSATPKYQSVENQFGDEKAIVWGEKDESGDRNSSDKSNEDKNNSKGKKRGSKESNETYRNRASDKGSSTVAYNDDNTLNNEEPQENPLQLEHDEIKKKTIHLLRREGDRTFTFEESPDYLEYHEKLAEVRKKKSNKTE